jgi:alpha-methylacyl-CoA racemase
MTMALRGMGEWRDDRASNLLDGGAPFYDTYRCADGGFVAVGALEPRFFAALLDGLGIRVDEIGPQRDRSGWSQMRRRFAEVFATRSRDDWCSALADTEACVTPVLTFEEAPRHPHLAARATYVEAAGGLQPAPAPRFSRSTTTAPGGPPSSTTVSDVLRRWAEPHPSTMDFD